MMNVGKLYDPAGPQKYEKNTEKKYKSGPKITIFVFFRYFFRVFGAPPWVGGFVFFS